MTATIKLDGNWSSLQVANSAPALSVTDSAIAPTTNEAPALSVTDSAIAPKTNEGANQVAGILSQNVFKKTQAQDTQPPLFRFRFLAPFHGYIKKEKWTDELLLALAAGLNCVSTGLLWRESTGHLRRKNLTGVTTNQLAIGPYGRSSRPFHICGVPEDIYICITKHVCDRNVRPPPSTPGLRQGMYHTVNYELRTNAFNWELARYQEISSALCICAHVDRDSD